MNESLAATLGELQAQIYWLHDAEEFTKLATVAANIYLKLGYSEEQSATAGNLISKNVIPILVVSPDTKKIIWLLDK